MTAYRNSKDVVMKTRIAYTGIRTSESLDAFCKENSKGCYVVASTGFSETFVYKLDKLPVSNYAPSDYPDGYYKNGKQVQWSKARKIACQNAGMTRD